jgi:hypothetical protein
MTRVENAAPASKAPVPSSTLRREIFGFFIVSFCLDAGWIWYTGSYLLFLLSTPESFVDSSFLLPLDLAAGFGQTRVQRRTKQGFGRLK